MVSYINFSSHLLKITLGRIPKKLQSRTAGLNKEFISLILFVSLYIYVCLDICIALFKKH